MKELGVKLMEVLERNPNLGVVVVALGALAVAWKALDVMAKGGGGYE